MAVEIFANRPSTTVTSGGTTAPASGTVENWTVASSAGFPAASSSAGPPTQFHVADPVHPTEQILVTNISGATWTVTRGAESTTPVAHSAGFTVYQDVSAGAFAQLRVTDYLNAQTMFGATGNGSTDDTAALQNALTALQANGGVLYIPGGTYKVTSTLSYSSAQSLYILGAGEGTTVINRASAVAPFHSLDIQNVTGSDGVTIENLTISNVVNAGSFSDDQVGIYASNCQRVRLQNVSYTASGNRVNIGVHANNCTVVSLIACDIRGYVNALLCDGGTAVIDCIGSAFYTNPGSGVSTSGNIVLNVNAGTLHLTNCETNGGDHGLVVTGGSSSNPAFYFIHDLEINNCHGSAVVLNTGSQAWFNQLWCSNQGVANNEGAYHGISVASGYGGWVVVDNSTFQHLSGHGVFLQGGQSYWVTSTSFSGCCGNAANTYDDIHVSAAASIVHVKNCNFDLEPFNTPTPPRSGVYIESGATSVLVTDNQFGTGYGTGPVVNLAASGSVRVKNNLGYNPAGKLSSPPAVATSTSAVTNTTGFDCMVIVTVSGSGSATSISIGGQATGISSSVASAVLPPVRVPAGQTITLTYVNGPTWAWFADLWCPDGRS